VSEGGTDPALISSFSDRGPGGYKRILIWRLCRICTVNVYGGPFDSRRDHATDLSVRVLPSSRGKSASRFRAVRFVKQVCPSHLLDLPFKSEFREPLIDKPVGDGKDAMIGEDSLRSFGSPEVIDQPYPHERVKAEGPDFGDQISRTKLELSIKSRLICRSSYLCLSQTTGHHELGSHRLNLEGPSTRAAE
jgi:hypothetical protein